MRDIDKILSRIGKPVKFKYPEGKRRGVLRDRVVIPAGLNPTGVRYWHVVDLIEWPEERRREHWIRIGYYRRRKDRLVFAGQTTATYRISHWKRLMVTAGKEAPWFGDLLREVFSKIKG